MDAGQKFCQEIIPFFLFLFLFLFIASTLLKGCNAHALKQIPPLRLWSACCSLAGAGVKTNGEKLNGYAVKSP